MNAHISLSDLRPGDTIYCAPGALPWGWYRVAGVHRQPDPEDDVFTVVRFANGCLTGFPGRGFFKGVR